MIKRRSVVLAMASPIVTELHAATPRITNVRFGVLKAVSEGVFDFVQPTNRIPRRYKSTGFRWGIGFDNPDCAMIEWYELVHLPEELKEVSGNFQRTRTKTMRTKTFKDDRPSVVDEFWFDEGDPLGRHRIELFVGGQLIQAFDFTVVSA